MGAALGNLPAVENIIEEFWDEKLDMTPITPHPGGNRS